MATIKRPKLGQHVCFLGKTGSGKSLLAQTLINSYPSDVRVFSIDTDNSIKLDGSKTVRSPTEAKFWYHFYKKLRYVPDREYKNRESWDDIFYWLQSTSSMKKPNPIIIHINEIYRLGYGTNFPLSLGETMATARKSKISMFIETQRPKAIPILVLTEASRIYVWVLNREDDRKYVAGYSGVNAKEFVSILNNQKKDYSFIGIDTDEGIWQKYNPIKI